MIMKIRKITTVIMAVLLLGLFLPIFSYTVFQGNNVNYYEGYKIETLYSNKVLLLLSGAAFLVFFALYFFLRKLSFNKRNVIGTVVISFVTCVAFYIVKVEISKCIAFYGGWDCGMVANSVYWIYEGADMGYDDYYYIFSNNVPIVWLLLALFKLSNALTNYPYNSEFIWIQFQCLMFALAVFFSVMTVLVVSKKIAPAIMCLFVSIAFFGLCPWQIIPYTDASTVAFPVLTVFFYALFRYIPSKGRYFAWWFSLLFGMMGGIIKPTCYVAVIAVVLTECVWLFSEKEGLVGKLKKLVLRLILLTGVFLLASLCKKGIYRALDYVPDETQEITMLTVFYSSLNEEVTGGSSGDEMNLAREYAGQPPEVRRAAELQNSMDRIRQKGGIRGLLDFWLRKQVMNFNDGTFSWFQEGFFHAWDYEEITDSRFKEPLRDFYWNEGDNYLKFTTWSQGIWLFILTGIVLEAIAAIVTVINLGGRQDVETLCIHTVGILIFVGLFLFVMLFEGRARYLFNQTAVFVMLAVAGYCGLAREICRLFKAQS